MNEGLIHLKVKVKHLAEETRIIRGQEQQAHGMTKWNLQHHRKTKVRNAARQTQFAYAILRGKTLDRTAPGWSPHILQEARDEKEVKRMLRKYGELSEAEANAAWKRWVAGEVVKVKEKEVETLAV